MIIKRDGSRPETALVTFTLPSTIWASSANLVADFNRWQPIPMRHNGSDELQATVELRRGHTYHFRYLLNEDQWCTDGLADGHAKRFGAHNSVLQL